MDSEETNKKYQEMVDHYGDQLPNYIHEPRRFEYYVRLMTWRKQIEMYTVDSQTK